MVMSEVESRARMVHDFYSFQFNDVQQDRAQMFTDFIKARGKSPGGLVMMITDLIRTKGTSHVEVIYLVQGVIKSPGGLVIMIADLNRTRGTS